MQKELELELSRRKRRRRRRRRRKMEVWQEGLLASKKVQEDDDEDVTRLRVGILMRIA